MKKKDNIIIFDMPGKDYMPSHGCLSLVSYLFNKRWNVEYCDLNKRAFKIFSDRSFFLKFFEKFEKELAQDKSVQKRIIRFYIKKYIKIFENEPSNMDPMEFYLLFCLLLGGRYHYFSYKTKKSNLIVNDLFNHLILRNLYNQKNGHIIFSRLFLNSDAFQKWLEKKIRNKNILCFSLLYSYQNDLFKIIAENIKKKFPEKQIIIGGQGVMRYWKSDLISRAYFNYCDFVIIGEGEEALFKLLKYLNNSYKLERIPNVIHLQKNKITINRFDYFHDMNNLPPLHLNKRMIKEYNIKYLEYETGRGCKWQKCAFCNYHLGANLPYRTKDPKKIISELRILKNDTGVSYFYFLNNELDINHALEISKEIIKKKLGIRWESWMRFDNQISLDKLMLLKKSGCSKLRFGLESGDKRMNKFIRKGVDLDKAEEIIKNCKKADIDAVLLTMIGFPCESLISVLRTINFIRKNKKYLSMSYTFKFGAFPYIPMVKKQKKYGIKKLINKEGEFIAYKNNFFRKHLLNPLLYSSRYLLSDKKFKFRF